jgi:hypothetical protein
MKTYLISSLSLALAVSASAQVTALNNSAHRWNTLEWTSGAPNAAVTAFLNDNTVLTIDDGTVATAKGIRMGNVISSTTSLEMLGGSLSLEFIVVGNSVTSNASYYQAGGALKVTDTTYTDFMLGSPEGASASPCFATAVFEGGSASLADIVFNISDNRKLTLTVDGSLVDLSAKSISVVPHGMAPKKATIEFAFDRRGISPIKVSNNVGLGAGDQVDLKIDGSKYKGSQARFVLIETPSLQGKFSDIIIEGFEGGASVYAEESNIILTIP